ncbi:hypothetical protein FOA52_007029 [Chlamydomonas sp. UWO 241]|nr:hypothetical protein FOA52_007029 [Chlamydomonas sp. UWO 241]
MKRGHRRSATAGAVLIDSYEVPLLPFTAHALDAFKIDAEPAGTGAFSRTLRATCNADGSVWALKLMHLSKESRTSTAAWASQEAHMHARLATEPCIVPLKDAFRTQVCSACRAMDFAVLQMPLQVGNLRNHLTHGAETIWGGAEELAKVELLPLATRREMVIQLVNSVRTCHEHGIVHRDIKLENFLVGTDGRLLLCDFGLASLLAHPDSRVSDKDNLRAAAGSGGGAKTAQGGTAWTMSPGRLEGFDEGGASDWWSLGVVAYQVMTGGVWPFKASWSAEERADGHSVQAAIARAVRDGVIHFPPGFPPDAAALIHGLLAPDPKLRWGLNEVLASAFVTDGALDSVAARHPPLARHMAELRARRRALLATRAAAARRAARGGGAGRRGGDAAAAAATGVEAAVHRRYGAVVVRVAVNRGAEVRAAAAAAAAAAGCAPRVGRRRQRRCGAAPKHHHRTTAAALEQHGATAPEHRGAAPPEHHRAPAAAAASPREHSTLPEAGLELSLEDSTLRVHPAGRMVTSQRGHKPSPSEDPLDSWDPSNDAAAPAGPLLPHDRPDPADPAMSMTNAMTEAIGPAVRSAVAAAGAVGACVSSTMERAASVAARGAARLHRPSALDTGSGGDGPETGLCDIQSPLVGDQGSSESAIGGVNVAGGRGAGKGRGPLESVRALLSSCFGEGRPGSPKLGTHRTHVQYPDEAQV